MPREISIEMPFAMGAEDFWALRMDRNFDVFCGACDQPRLRPYRHTDPTRRSAAHLPYCPSPAATQLIRARLPPVPCSTQHTTTR